MAEEEEGGDPEIFKGEQTERFGEREAAEINLQRRVGDVLEGEPCREDLDGARKEIQRDEEAAEQFDEPELCANQREDGGERNGARADDEIERAHDEKAAEGGDGEQNKIH